MPPTHVCTYIAYSTRRPSRIVYLCQNRKRYNAKIKKCKHTELEYISSTIISVNKKLYFWKKKIVLSVRHSLKIEIGSKHCY